MQFFNHRPDRPGVLVALGLLLFNLTALDAPDLAGSLADDFAPMADPDSAPVGGDLLPQTGSVLDLAPEWIAPGTDVADADDPEEGHPDADVGLEDQFGHEPQRLAFDPARVVAEPALDLGLPCVILHSDMVSGSSCPREAHMPLVLANSTDPGTLHSTKWGHYVPTGRWAWDLGPWSATPAQVDPLPRPAPDDNDPHVDLVPQDDTVAPSPISGAQVLAWVGRAAAMLAPTVLLAKLLASSALHRRRRDSPARDALLALVAADPGIHYMELVRRSGLGNGTVQHHLRALLDSGQLVRVRTAGHACFFPDAAADPALVAVRTAARSPVTRRVLTLLDEAPRTLSALAADAALPVSTVHYHVGKLTKAGALAPQRVAGRRALVVTPLGRQAIARTQ